jgi:alpha-1,3-mannosyltransferase
MAQVQLAIAVPFLPTNAKGYLGRAFELSRQFKFEWTVNWRMLGEEVFLSRPFALALLGCHVVFLLIFIIVKWLQPADRPLLDMIKSVIQLKPPFTPPEERRVSLKVTPEFVMTTMLSANVIGLLFARSLHYQFYAYLAWSTPYLIWRFWSNPLVVYGVWLAQEWAWNVFPSTPISSAVVVNVLGLTVLAAYFSSSEDERAAQAQAEISSSEPKKTK